MVGSGMARALNRVAQKPRNSSVLIGKVMQIAMSALALMTSIGSVAAEWSVAVLDSSSETGLLVLWGLLLLRAGQSVRTRTRVSSEEPDSLADGFFDSASTQRV